MHDDTPHEGKPSRPAASRSRRSRWRIRVPVIAIVLLLLSPVFYRQWLLSRVPDIGVPFATAEILAPIPEEDNAFPLFEEAYALLAEVDEADSREYWRQRDQPWHPAPAQSSDYLELNRPSLEKWREATEKDDYQFVPIARVSEVYFVVTNTQASRDLVWWCQREVERLIETGKPAEALPWLRASFRSAALSTRNATWVDRLVAEALLSISTISAETWMRQPHVSAESLLQLLEFIQESTRLIEKPSVTVKMEYLTTQRHYAEWSYDEVKELYGTRWMDRHVGSRWEAWLRAEPEFSRRLTAHLAANHLPFVDAPRRERPPVLDGHIFDEAAVGATADGRLPAHDLLRVLKKARLLTADDTPLLEGVLSTVDRAEVSYACLQVALAAQAYYRRHGEFPARLEDLQPDYLAQLPDDPFAPRPAPVIYRRTADGAVVYSRYWNGIDDGGTIVTYGEARGGDLPDLGIRIRRPVEPPVVAPRP